MIAVYPGEGGGGGGGEGQGWRGRGCHGEFPRARVKAAVQISAGLQY